MDTTRFGHTLHNKVLTVTYFRENGATGTPNRDEFARYARTVVSGNVRVASQAYRVANTVTRKFFVNAI